MPDFLYYRAQVQPVPHWQVAPQRHPGLRVPVFFLDIGSSFVRPTRLSGRLDAELREHLRQL